MAGPRSRLEQFRTFRYTVFRLIPAPVAGPRSRDPHEWRSDIDTLALIPAPVAGPRSRLATCPRRTG